jgi:uncharacterized integral membrane protein (TIGR00698 family)
MTSRVVAAARAAAPGLAVAAAAAVLATYGAGAIGGLDAVTLAVALGVLIGNLRTPRSWRPGLDRAASTMLDLSVVLLGLQLDALDLVAIGPGGLALVVASVLAAVAGSAWLGRRLGLPTSLSSLLGYGSGICGSSAIAATSPFVGRSRAGDAALAVGVVNVLGAIGMIALPAVARALDLSPRDGALLVGGTLQAVGHVVAAGFSLGSETGELATAVKMARVALLPLIVAVLAARQGSASGGAVPAYLVGFGVAVLLRSLGLVPEGVQGPSHTAAKWVLTLAMVGLGSKISVAALREEGWRAVALGASLTSIQIAVMLIGSRWL